MKLQLSLKDFKLIKDYSVISIIRLRHLTRKHTNTHTHSLILISVIFMIITNSREEILVYHEILFCCEQMVNPEGHLLNSSKHVIKHEAHKATSQSHKMSMLSVWSELT